MTYTPSSSSTSTCIFSNENIKKLLAKLILNLLNDNLKVYLDGLGIVYSKTKQEKINYFQGSRSCCRLEEKRSLHFEKSYEITAYDYKQNKNIIDTKELACRFIARLNKSSNYSFNIKFITKELKVFFNELRSELLLNAKSDKLGGLGTFYALKLDSELSWQEKFSKADILLIGDPFKNFRVQEEYSFETPVLKSAYEPLESFFGKAISKKSINLEQEINSLGLNISEDLDYSKNPQLKYSIFSAAIQNNNEHIIFCTEQMAEIAHFHNPNSIGSELIIQISVPKGNEIPKWPKKLFALAWILLNSHNKKRLNAGHLLNYDLSDLFDAETNLTGILTTSFDMLPGTYLSLSGTFKYTNLLGISEAEQNLANKFGTMVLLQVLKQKKYDQLTKSKRINILS